VIELLPNTEGKQKMVGSKGRAASYIYAFAVDHFGLDKAESDKYILNVSKRFAEMLTDALKDENDPRKTVFCTNTVYEMHSCPVSQMIRDEEVFRILDDVVNFLEDGTDRRFEFKELLEHPDMKLVLSKAFGEENVLLQEPAYNQIVSDLMEDNSAGYSYK
jgi:hypothetical protein